MRERFDAAWEKVRKQSNRHAAVKSETDDFETIAASRAELEEARAEAVAARREIVKRRDYATPEAVPAGLGVDGATGRALWMTGFGAIAFLAIVVVAVVVVMRSTAADPLEIDGEIVESVDDCVWKLEVPLRNGGDRDIIVTDAIVVIDARRVPFERSVETLRLQPSAKSALVLERRMTPCPSAPDDVEHDRLWLTWNHHDSPTDEILRHSF